MIKNTVLILQFVADHSLKLYELDLHGALINSTIYSDLSEVHLPEPKQRLIILLPSKMILTAKVRIPKTHWQNVLKAAPFLLEERVAVPVHSLHVTVSKTDQPEHYLVTAIDKSLFEHYFNQIKSQGLTPVAIVPDFLSLPLEPEKWTLKVVENMAWLRTSLWEGLMTDTALLSTVLQLKLREKSAPVVCQVITEQEEMTTLLSQQFEEKIEFIRQTAKVRFDKHLLSGSFPINLLQGPYRFKTKNHQHKKHRFLLWFSLGLWLLILIGGKMGEYFLYKHFSAQLAAEMAAIIGPGEPREIKIDLQRKLRQLSQRPKTDPAIQLLAKVGGVIKNHSTIELNSFNYNHDELVMEVKASHLSELEDFSRALEQSKIIIKHNRIQTGENNITDQLTVTGLSK